MSKFDFLKNKNHKFIRLQENELLNAEKNLGLSYLKNLEIST